MIDSYFFNFIQISDQGEEPFVRKSELKSKSRKNRRFGFKSPTYKKYSRGKYYYPRSKLILPLAKRPKTREVYVDDYFSEDYFYGRSSRNSGGRIGKQHDLRNHSSLEEDRDVEDRRKRKRKKMQKPILTSESQDYYPYSIRKKDLKGHISAVSKIYEDLKDFVNKQSDEVSTKNYYEIGSDDEIIQNKNGKSPLKDESNIAVDYYFGQERSELNPEKKQNYQRLGYGKEKQKPLSKLNSDAKAIFREETDSGKDLSNRNKKTRGKKYKYEKFDDVDRSAEKDRYFLKNTLAFFI